MPKLHVRDLFWLVLVVAMGCAWWIDRQHYKSVADEASKDARWKLTAFALASQLEELGVRPIIKEPMGDISPP